MATIATRTIAFLKNQSTVTGYVRNNIFETRPPQGKGEPFIVVRRITTENADCLNDSAGQGPLQYGLQIDCTATKESDANAVGDAVRGCLHLYRGTFDDSTAKGCFVDSESLDFQRFNDASDEGYFTRTLETRIFL